MNKGKKVVLGMSGGVDSSVAAYVLKEQGYDVIGITMQIWQDDGWASGGCCGASAADDARMVAETIGIPHYVLNFKKEFKKDVIDYFIDEYFEGKTPNPCIACNRYVKWEALLNRAFELGADYIATGHYGSIAFLDNKRYALKVSKGGTKDQTYALYNLTQKQLAHTLMPIGQYSKQEVRAIASQLGLNVADKKDSQEICFIPDNDYGGFIRGNTDREIATGDFVDMTGNVLGRHKGIVYYTVGQRKGLGVTFGKPMYVKEIRPKENQVVLSDDDKLFSNSLTVGDVNFMAEPSLSKEMNVMAKIRYSHRPAEATIKLIGDVVECIFKEPQRAVTPGQAAVFYSNELVVAGGVILH